MGLDQYVYKIEKTKLEERIYTSAELRELGLNFTEARNVDEYPNLYADLLPYAIKRYVSSEYYDVEKMIADYNLPSNSHVWMQSYDKIALGGKTDDGERVQQEITREEIEEKYTVTKTFPYYIWKESEVAYWRKNYNLQDLVYDALGNVDNTKYCILNKDIIREINREFRECLPLKEPTKRSALFYWEWY